MWRKFWGFSNFFSHYTISSLTLSHFDFPKEVKLCWLESTWCEVYKVYQRKVRGKIGQIDRLLYLICCKNWEQLPFEVWRLPQSIHPKMRTMLLDEFLLSNWLNQLSITQIFRHSSNYVNVFFYLEYLIGSNSFLLELQMSENFIIQNIILEFAWIHLFLFFYFYILFATNKHVFRKFTTFE